MAFSINRRRQRTTTATEPTSEPDAQLADAEAALNVLLDERAQVRETLAEHQQQRESLLQDNDGDLSKVIDLDRLDYAARLRLQQLENQFSGAQDEVRQAQLALHNYRWTLFRPRLVVAQQELAQCIGALFNALDHLRATHSAAHHAGFGGHLGEFLRVPPGGKGDTGAMSDHALREFERHATGHAVVVARPIEGDELIQLDQMHLPPARRFKPIPVPKRLIEEQSPLETRRVKMKYTINSTNLSVGHAKLWAGDEMEFGARVAFILTYSGVGEYTDNAQAAEASAAVA